MARYGGDEVAIILPNTGQEGAVTVGERLRIGAAPFAAAAGSGESKTGSPRRQPRATGISSRRAPSASAFARTSPATISATGAEPPLVTISVGVASLRECTDAGTDLVERADRALYAAKRLGKNRVEVAES